MIAGWAVVLCALLYLCALFAVAHYGDKAGGRVIIGPARPTIYALALAVYCTSWTFYGSVGLASRSGLDFLAIYLGPILVVGFGWRWIARIVDIAKSQNITSIADFLAARYGKSERVAAIVCLIAVVGAVPYISLQLKAVSSSLTVLLSGLGGAPAPTPPFIGDLALVVALVLAAFAMAFGTRHIDATEHQDGLVLAIALESVVKLVAFLAVGLFVTYWMFDGIGDLANRLNATGAPDMAARTTDLGSFLTNMVLAAFAIVLLPRQFHVGVVENRSLGDIRRAAWMFPLYLVAINIFVLPIAMAGEIMFGPGEIDRDMTVLALPRTAGADLPALVAFIGGLSAATAMVIVESVAIAIMISNHLVMPLVVRRRGATGERGEDLSGVLLFVRRLSILVVILLGYLYYRSAGAAELAAIGLLSFAAIAQIGPAFLGGLMWRRGTALGATAGLAGGFIIWAYTLLLPSLAPEPGTAHFAAHVLADGPFGVGYLKPTALFGSEMPRLMHGVVWSLAINALLYVGASLLRPATGLEKLQASIFAGRQVAPAAQNLRLWGASVTVDELKATIARYIGQERAQRAFENYGQRSLVTDGKAEADAHMLRFAEHLLASAIGAASSRLVLSLLLRRRSVSTKAALKLLDDASAAIQYNRDMLQHALDHARQGITIIDRDLRVVAWNRAFTDLYALPPDLVRVGTDLEDILRFNAERGTYGPGLVEDLIAARLTSFTQDREPVRLKLFPDERVIELRTNHLPDGGLVTTYTDITDSVEAEEALARANETLERRVRERTEELLRVNTDLARAKAQAEEANASKTRFLAAASHDILQPLNAARLYITALVERDRNAGIPDLAENVDASLDAVEEILTALLDISRLDAGAMKAEVATFRLDELTRQLQREFEPLAAEKQLRLKIVHSSLTIRSDRRLLRRLMQNLVSNAIKYTPAGTVLVGVRRRRGKARIEVWDTGIGIPQSKQKAVFLEFERLDQAARVARGIGLGLSIVERIARVLGHTLTLRSKVGKGSGFLLEVPVAAPLPELMPVVEAKPTPGAPLAGMTVLAIDNEPTILEGMRLLLSGWGCRILTAESLKGARQALKRPGAKIDVIIADYHLDDGDGIEAITALRWTLGQGLPAILLTADRTPEVREKAEGRDIHVLAKPLKPATLRALLAQWRATRIAAE